MNSGANKMSEKDFDNKLKSIMEQDTLHAPVPQSGWEKIFIELHPENEQRPLPVVGQSQRVLLFRKWAAVACGLAIVALGSYWTINTFNTTTNQTTVPSITQDKIPHNTTPIDHTTTPECIIENIAEGNNSTSNAPIANKYASSNKTTITYNTNISDHTTITTPSKTATTPHKEGTGSVVVESLEPRTNNTQRDVAEVKEVQQINTNPYLHNNDAVTQHYANHTSTNATHKNISLGVNGGYNFGTLNSGYALAINAKTQVSSDVFIGGTIGVAMNNIQTTNTTAVSIPVSNAKARPSAGNQNSVNLPAVTSTTHNLAYIQFNPSVGYNISKNITFSIGGDVQRLVTSKGSEDINVVFDPTQNQSSLIPKTDLGITGKTEFKLAKNISTALVYREGVNNLVSNATNGMDYLNRRYIQVQLSYHIPIKL
jgi:hypothetical protein